MSKATIQEMDKQIQIRDLHSSFENMEHKVQRKGNIFVSKDQELVAKRIFKHFKHGKRLVTLVAQPQWGKTGTVLMSAYLLCTQIVNNKLVNADNVFTITGLSDTVWERQTKSRLLPQFRKNVYHRARIKKMIPKLYSAEDAVIIIDECHFGSSANQQLKLALNECNLLDLNNLQTRNIYILQTSATPDNVLIDSISWGGLHAIVKPHKGNTYTSFEDLYNAGCLEESLDLTDPEQTEDLFEVMLEYYEPRYHIIRVPRRGAGGREEILDNINAFCQDFDIDCLFYDSTNKIKDIDILLATQPENHTIIIITDFWRAAKTLNDSYIGVVHERLVKSPNSTTIVQSLAGRCVGHNKNIVNGPKIYTHLQAVEQYIELCKLDFNYVDTKYRSTGVRSHGDGRIHVSESYAHDCIGVEHRYIESKELNRYGWRIFDGKDPLGDAQRFAKKYLDKKLPEKRKNNGFYVQNDVNEDPLYIYSRYFKGVKPFNKKIFKGLSGNSAKKLTNWRQYALYKDPTDVNSLVWFICWRRNAFPNIV